MCNNLKLQGKLMYACKVVGMLIKRVNRGLMEPEKQTGGIFRLEQWDEAFKAAQKNQKGLHILHI
ncbi:hypothetical protein V8C34DRAFT_305797 [Trichoderma compactum]